MATSKTLLVCPIVKSLLIQKSLNQIKTKLPLHRLWHKRCFTISRTCNQDCLKTKVNVANSGDGLLQHRYISTSAINVKNNYHSDNHDRVDRHVSIGEGLDKFHDKGSSMHTGADQYESTQTTFCPRKVLLLTKLSRYQFERHQYAKDMSETEFRRALEKRGSDYTLIKYYNNVHKSVEEKIVQALEKRGIEIKVCERMEYCDKFIEWADLVVTVGGDGTFLFGASKIKNRNKPMIGINSDPTRSEGHLCLPKHWSLNVDDAIQAIIDGKVIQLKD